MIQVRIIEDLETEPITLEDAKSWMQIDYPDFDDLIELLIKSSREISEKNSSQAYGIKTIRVTGNQACERVYPIQPFIETVDEDPWSYENYTYKAGFQVLPMDLKVAVLQRVATGFAYRQNGLDEAVNKAVNHSINAEIKYREDFYI